MSHHTWVHRGVRRLVRPLASTPVTPNHLTALRLLTGLGAALAVASGDTEGLAGGALLFTVSFILDRADGELARLTDRISASGHRFDLWADSLSNALIFIGLGIGLRDGALGLWALPLGLAAGASVSAVLWLVMRAEALAGPRSAELGSLGGFDPDDAMLLVPLGLLLGWAEPLLLAAGLVTPVFALAFLRIIRRRLHPQSPN